MLVGMKRYIASLLLILLVAAVAAFAADVTGAWAAKVPARGEEQDTTFNFKQAGEKLTGTVVGPMGETPIADGKVTGDDISFVQNLDFGGNAINIMYKGKVSGSEIKFTREVEGRGNPRDFVAKKK